MVRHEAAEALGGIVGEGAHALLAALGADVYAVRSAPRDADADSAPVDVLAVLKEWSQREDAPRVVRESCVVAVDMWEVRAPAPGFLLH